MQKRVLNKSFIIFFILIKLRVTNEKNRYFNNFINNTVSNAIPSVSLPKLLNYITIDSYILNPFSFIHSSDTNFPR